MAALIIFVILFFIVIQIIFLYMCFTRRVIIYRPTLFGPKQISRKYITLSEFNPSLTKILIEYRKKRFLFIIIIFWIFCNILFYLIGIINIYTRTNLYPPWSIYFFHAIILLLTIIPPSILTFKIIEYKKFLLKINTFNLQMNPKTTFFASLYILPTSQTADRFKKIVTKRINKIFKLTNQNGLICGKNIKLFLKELEIIIMFSAILTNMLISDQWYLQHQKPESIKIRVGIWNWFENDNIRSQLRDITFNYDDGSTRITISPRDALIAFRNFYSSVKVCSPTFANPTIITDKYDSK